jgi:O-antigen ligase
MWKGLVSTDEYSISTRFDAWSILAQIIKINPVLGLGFANYYWYTPLFRIRGYAVSFNSHNNYVDIVAQTGFVGLICFLLFIWQVGWLGWRLREQAPAGFAQAYVYGALGGLAGMVVVGMMGDWILPFFYNIGLSGFRSSMLGWLFLGGLVSLEQMVRIQKSTAARQ